VLLSSLADFATELHFGRGKVEHANARHKINPVPLFD